MGITLGGFWFCGEKLSTQQAPSTAPVPRTLTSLQQNPYLGHGAALGIDSTTAGSLLCLRGGWGSRKGSVCMQISRLNLKSFEISFCLLLFTA